MHHKVKAGPCDRQKAGMAPSAQLPAEAAASGTLKAAAAFVGA